MNLGKKSLKAPPIVKRHTKSLNILAAIAVFRY